MSTELIETCRGFK